MDVSSPDRPTRRAPSGVATKVAKTSEGRRILANERGDRDWYAWGPYLAERQWGTVREDYSATGDAWSYFPYEQAHLRSYRWGEDGIAGYSDSDQLLCLSLALWNRKDSRLKERMWGLTNEEANHGEDVKELYYYLDATPSHSYAKMLYKYPQAEFPYEQLARENKSRSRGEPEFEIWDTGVFDQGRYFDVFVEYAKSDVDDLVMQVTVVNRGPVLAQIDVLPQLWFRNTWAWYEGRAKPRLWETEEGIVVAKHDKLGEYRFQVDPGAQLLFTENETNPALWGKSANGCYKDAFHRYLIDGERSAVSTSRTGTKVAALHRLELGPGESRTLGLRLRAATRPMSNLSIAETVDARCAEADEYYAALQQELPCEDRRLVQRQALAGMIWTKQFFYYDVNDWLNGDPNQPAPPSERVDGRNADWRHLNNADIISMPDTWEYPWYAAWDLAFHCLPLALVDSHFAKKQLKLLTREWYMHPNGQIPAYEWNFGDVNPPVHAWAAWRVFQIDRKRTGGHGDLAFLESIFHKLMLNFTWWVNRKDAEGNNIFQGGFLGLDNIGVFDRSKPLPTGGHIEQSDGTSWMAMYALNLMRMALELALHNAVYEDIATKFFEHFLLIAQAMTNLGGEGGLWDDDDKFYYDVLNLPDGDSHRRVPLRLRSLVGLIPLFAVETIEPELLERLPGFRERLEWVMDNRPDLAQLVSRWEEPGRGKRRLLSLLRGHRVKRLLARMLDPNEFLSEYGVRSLSKIYGADPYVFEHAGVRYEVRYTPAESDSSLFGGNSNWRGPIWMPVNYLLIESLQCFHHYYGDDFKVECPTGSGQFVTLDDVATELAGRLAKIFLRGDDNCRPVFGHSALLREHPEFRDYVQFYEYFDGDSGRGVGASHQTGWTGIVAKLVHPRRSVKD